MLLKPLRARISSSFHPPSSGRKRRRNHILKDQQLRPARPVAPRGVSAPPQVAHLLGHFLFLVSWFIIISASEHRGDGGALGLEGAPLLLDEAILLLADGGGLLGPEGHRRRRARCPMSLCGLVGLVGVARRGAVLCGLARLRGAIRRRKHTAGVQRWLPMRFCRCGLASGM